MHALPPSFLVQVEHSIAELAKWPKKLSWSHWDELTPIASMKSLDGDRSPEAAASAMQLSLAWHDEGLLVGAEVSGKSAPPKTYPRDPSDSDSVAVFLDLRNTKGIRRASRFCHSFRIVPFDKIGQQDVKVVQEPVPRAREDAPFRDLPSIGIAQRTTSGYQSIAVLPKANLNGYEPRESTKAGFFAMLRDNELGDEPFTGDLLLPSSVDPSMWSTLKFESGKR